MSRDIREPFVVYSARDGYTNHPVTVASTSINSRIGYGHYVMVPVLNEQAGYAFIDEMKRRAVQPTGDA